MGRLIFALSRIAVISNHGVSNYSAPSEWGDPSTIHPKPRATSSPQKRPPPKKTTDRPTKNPNQKPKTLTQSQSEHLHETPSIQPIAIARRHHSTKKLVTRINPKHNTNITPILQTSTQHPPKNDMYLTTRSAIIRNIAVALLNGLVTLGILLIAPMGLAGVISNTILVTLGSLINATLSDSIVRYLQPNRHTQRLNNDRNLQQQNNHYHLEP
jgi:hypothetical protein